MSGPAIRRIETDDEIEQCAELLASNDPWKKLGVTKASAIERFHDPASENFIIAGLDGVRGLIMLYLKGGPFTGYIRTICVAPAERGKGLGTELIRFAEELIFSQKPNVFMCVSSFNPDAQRLYERLGYKRIGEIEDFIMQGHSEILLRKTRGPLAGYRG